MPGSDQVQNYPGALHIGTDTWTSPNHRPFAAFTVHLVYEGRPFSFLLDVVEIPEVTTSYGLHAEADAYN